MSDKLKPKGPKPRQILDFVEGLNLFSPDEDGEGSEAAVTLQISGPKKSNLVVIVGENASGKSFLRRVVHEAYQRIERELIAISQEGRRKVSYSPFLVFVYGDEERESTGYNAAGTVLGAFKTSKAREKEHGIFWDEPDTGLSEGWSACMGREIAEFLSEKPEKLAATFLVTHSKPMVRELKAVDPIFVYVGSDRQFDSIDAWLDAPIPKYESLETLRKQGLDRSRKIQKLLSSAE